MSLMFNFFISNFETTTLYSLQIIGHCIIKSYLLSSVILKKALNVKSFCLGELLSDNHFLYYFDNHIGNIFFHRKDNGGLLVLLCSYLYLLFKLLNQCLNFIVSQHIGIFV